MDTALVVTKTPGLYFCPICGKPFTQEASHTRHVQYCRRRAATKRTVRPRACRNCRMTKSKCDAQWPCSRCTSRQKDCVYDKPWPLVDAAAALRGGEETETAQGADVGASSSDTAIGSDSNSPATTDEGSGQSNGQSCCPALSAAPPFTSADDSSSMMALAVTTLTTFSTTATTTAMAVDASTFSGGGIPNFLYPQNMYGLNDFGHFGSPGMGSASMPMAPSSMSVLPTVSMPSPISLHMPYAAPPDPVLIVMDGQVETGASIELRRLITSMVRTFPRMMTRPGSMPPFIHRVGCSLHYEEADGMALPEASSSSSTTFPFDDITAPGMSMSVSPSSQQALFTPLPPMAACVGISHAFVTRSPHSDEFLWRSIDKEHHAISQRLPNLSFGEILVSIQAMAIYTTMRLIVYGREYFFSDMSLLDTMNKLSERFHELWRSPFTPIHEENYDPPRSVRPTWEGWIFDETRRRITVTCWLMSLAVNPRGQSFRLGKPHRFPLPSSRRLWEADSRAAWEREFDNDQFETHILAKSGSSNNKTAKLTTIGDLARAIDKATAAEGCLGQPNNDALYEDDLLAHWHTGVDSLGMMVTAAAAQCNFDP